MLKNKQQAKAKKGLLQKFYWVTQISTYTKKYESCTSYVL